MESGLESQPEKPASVFGYFGLAICVLNDSFFIRSLLSLILVRTVLNFIFIRSGCVNFYLVLFSYST